MVIGIDPGRFGAVVVGKVPEDARVIPYPSTPEDFLLFPRNWIPGSVVFIEETISTVFRRKAGKTFQVSKSQDVAARALNREKGRWDVALKPWRGANERGTGNLFEIAPSTWRKKVFGTAAYAKGSMGWKRVEFPLANFLFPSMFAGLTEKFVRRGDHPVFGIAAASLIWLAGFMIENPIKGRELRKTIDGFLNQRRRMAQ